jgi:hypothetical protein
MRIQCELSDILTWNFSIESRSVVHWNVTLSNTFGYQFLNVAITYLCSVFYLGISAVVFWDSYLREMIHLVYNKYYVVARLIGGGGGGGNFPTVNSQSMVVHLLHISASQPGVCDYIPSAWNCHRGYPTSAILQLSHSYINLVLGPIIFVWFKKYCNE